MLSPATGLLDVVALTIGTDEEVTADLLQSLGTRSWSVSHYHFDTYLTAARRPSIGPRMKSAAGCLVFVDFDRSPEEAVETTKYLSHAFEGKILIVAMGRKPTSQIILSAMRAGCSEFLAKSPNQPALDMVFDRMEKNRSAEFTRTSQPGAVLAILGAKGGVGATTIAVHLATYLAASQGKKTLLIDQQRKLGHACVYLGIDGGNYAFQEVVRNLRRMDSELLQGFVARHSSGLEVMASPDSSGDNALLDHQELGRTIEFLRGEYDYIVVDCDRSQPESVRAIVDAATNVYLVATPEVGPIRDLARIIDDLLIQENSADKLQVVINRFSSPHAISIEQIEKVMKLPVSIKIPNSFIELLRATNTGRPVARETSSELAQAIARWSDSISGGPVRVARKGREHNLLAKWRQAIPAW